MLEVGRLLPRQSGWLFAEHDRVRTRLRFVLPHMPLDGPINSSTSPSDATHDVRCTGPGVQDICPRASSSRQLLVSGGVSRLGCLHGGVEHCHCVRVLCHRRPSLAVEPRARIGGGMRPAGVLAGRC